MKIHEALNLSKPENPNSNIKLTASNMMYHLATKVLLGLTGVLCRPTGMACMACMFHDT